MYPTIPAELFTGAVELVICLFTMITVLVSLAITTRS
jgi:hypothetical protein